MSNASTMTQDSVETFLQRLASSDATPGGGSAAAVMGAMGAALAAMVCNLTVGKPAYAEVDAPMRAALDRADSLRRTLLQMVAEDVAAFDTLMAAYKLPKASDEDKAARSAAIQSGLKGATEAPLACARACADVITLCADVAAQGNVNVISDAGVGVLAAHAALRSAALNVLINAPQIKDRAWAEARLAESAALESKAAQDAEQVLAVVRGKMG
jgi:formiminotetrahydrofolate cyclodeaminase